MKQDNIIIRREMPTDYAAVEHLTREAFWNVYRPGCLEHYVVHVRKVLETPYHRIEDAVKEAMEQTTLESMIEEFRGLVSEQRGSAPAL